jgi:hypothetical protein
LPTPWFFIALDRSVPSQLNRDDELDGSTRVVDRQRTLLRFQHSMKSLILAQDERWRRA